MPSRIQRSRAKGEMTRQRGFIYGIQQKGATQRCIKIGYVNAKTLLLPRLARLKTGNPFPLEIIFHSAGTAADERFLHRLLYAHRLAGEWFEAAPCVFLTLNRFAQGALTEEIRPLTHALFLAESAVGWVFGVRQDLLPMARR